MKKILIVLCSLMLMIFAFVSWFSYQIGYHSGSKQVYSQYKLEMDSINNSRDSAYNEHQAVISDFESWANIQIFIYENENHSEIK